MGGTRIDTVITSTAVLSKLQDSNFNFLLVIFPHSVAFFQVLQRKVFDIIIQSHSYIRRGNRRLSLAALPGLPTASQGIKLPLLANTRSVFSSVSE